MNDSNTERFGGAVSRRQLLTTGGAVGIGLLGGVSLLVRDARAAVSVDGLNVPDKSFEAEAIRPKVVVTAGYDYDVGSAVDVGSIALDLRVEETVVDSRTLSTDATALSNSEELRGEIAASEAWSESDFDVAIGESVTRDVGVSVWFGVLDPSGSAIVEAEASDTTAVTLQHPQENEYVATVGGTGVVVTTQ